MRCQSSLDLSPNSFLVSMKVRVAVWLFVWTKVQATLLSADFAREVLPLLKKHCFDCHGDEKEPKGGVNLKRFGADAAVLADRAVWEEIFKKVESHQMPPPKRDA